MLTAIDRAARPERPVTHARLAGAGAALVVAIVVGVIAVPVAGWFLLVGVPAASVAGWALGPRVRHARRTLLGLAMGVLTMVVADTLVVGALAAGSVAAGDPGRHLLAAMGGAVVLWGIGLVVVGLPILVVTIPCGIVWAYATERLVRDEGER